MLELAPSILANFAASYLNKGKQGALFDEIGIDLQRARPDRHMPHVQETQERQ